MKNILIILAVILALFNACKKEDPIPPADNGITPIMARDSLFDLMNQWYYWYNLMPTVNKENYSGPSQLMDAMRYKELDRWSFVADYDEFNAEMSGSFVGHGFRIGVDDTGNARIAMIYSKSGLYKNGVRRGWIVKKINGTDIAPILISGNSSAYSSLIGESVAGITNVFLLQRPDGSEVTISDTKSEFTINTVLLYDTLHLSSGVTGHLVFESFITPSAQELAIAFAFFKQHQVKDLILDLRYNSGGFLNIAQTLASYIVGDAAAGKTFAKLSYNNKRMAYNNTYPFKTTPYPLNLTRLVVISTRSTASASEAVMNGLEGFVNVVSIGDTTNGKPTGMNGWEVGKKYYFWPVTFKIVNSNDLGEYFDGILPSKLVEDDITHDFDDRDELNLKEAIYYLENGSVSTKGHSLKRAFTSSVQFSEKPSWREKGLLIETNQK
jgi:carboxyl-terminal processing protease